MTLVFCMLACASSILASPIPAPLPSPAPFDFWSLFSSASPVKISVASQAVEGDASPAAPQADPNPSRENNPRRPVFIQVFDDPAPAPQFLQINNDFTPVTSTKIAPLFVELASPTFYGESTSTTTEIESTTTTTTTTAETSTSTTEDVTSTEATPPPPPVETPSPSPSETPSPSPSPEPEPSPAPQPAPSPPQSPVVRVLRPDDVGECERSIHLGITSIFETGSPKLDYTVCVNNNDGHGYSFGIVQFTTSTSGYQVYTEYKNILQQRSTPLDRFADALKSAAAAGPQWSGWNADSRLNGFCDTMQSLKNDDAWKQAQMNVQRKNYLDPAYDLAARYGVSAPLFRGQVYDATIQLGLGGAEEIMKAAMNRARWGTSEDEQRDALKRYLDARESHLRGIGGEYAKTTYRVKSYRYAVDRFTAFTDHADVLLNSSDQSVSVRC
ncbi:hypothetical protein HDU97_005640 [Phlyctochytrium planicorne]|nr:hypothetical protein HDU97_005640 [Phlyctochytrium planicorne]